MEPTAPQLRVPHGNGREAAIWFFRAVALDLDGTLSVGTELHRVFPGLVGHFDAVVIENGAVLRTPRGRSCCTSRSISRSTRHWRTGE